MSENFHLYALLVMAENGNLTTYRYQTCQNMHVFKHLYVLVIEGCQICTLQQ